ncbi:hypothetical protein ACNO5M_22540, partial [Vibrio owensii]|uniref:hypothetical protein n=1 Tax=Vibrio owensii TaxID=696485 RepID=UPI003AACB090
YKNEPSIFDEIFIEKDKTSVLIEKVCRLIKGTKQEKTFAQFYAFLIKNHSSYHLSQIAKIEKKYSSIGRFDIANFD